MFTDGTFITLSGEKVVIFIFLVPVDYHGSQVVDRVVDVVLPSIVLPEGDWGQVGVLKVTLACIHCSNVSQLIAPHLYIRIAELRKYT